VWPAHPDLLFGLISGGGGVTGHPRGEQYLAFQRASPGARWTWGGTTARAVTPRRGDRRQRVALGNLLAASSQILRPIAEPTSVEKR
jgi:hypothetical protein